MTTVMSRRELFDLVWSKPVRAVAAELGVSDVAVHKICVKHRIPVPGRGAWAKHAAGMVLKPPRFLELKDSELNTIKVHGSTLAKLPPDVFAARQKAREETEARRAQQQTKPSEQIPLLGDLHKLAAQMKEKFGKAKTGGDGFIRISGRSVFSMAVTPANADRVMLFVHRLATEVEARGYSIGPGENALRILADGEAMVVAVAEKTDRVPHVITDKETAALRRWEAQRDRKQKRGEFVGTWDKPKFPEWDYVPNGKLTVTINEGDHWDGLRRRFSDTKSHGIEEMIDAIVEGLATLAAAEKAKRAAAEKQRQEWAEQERRRKDYERRRVLQQKRVEFVKGPMERFEDARRLEAFVNEYLARYPFDALPTSCRALIDWTKDYAELLRDSVAPDYLSELLDKHNLMDDAAEIGSWTSFDW